MTLTSPRTCPSSVSIRFAHDGFETTKERIVFGQQEIMHFETFGYVVPREAFGGRAAGRAGVP
nr:hypothetical protein GCM10010200_071740 [Actinomadura rugatobispora]